LYEVNFLFFIFYEAFTAQIENSLNSLSSSLLYRDIERELEKESIYVCEKELGRRYIYTHTHRKRASEREYLCVRERA
jgi:hypothetical protein